MSKEELAASEYIEGTVLAPFHDRELSAIAKVLDDAYSFGGMYYSPRKKAPLLLNAEGKTPKRMSWGESTQRYINSLGDLMPINEYRVAATERFMNSLNAAAKKEGLSYGIHPQDIGGWSKGEILIRDANLRKMFEDNRQYLVNRLTQLSDDERMFHNFSLQMADFMSGKAVFGVEAGNTIEKTMLRIAKKDPSKALAAASFQTLLGFFNPRNLYVQAQQATLAVSMHPVLGMAASTKAIPMHALIGLPDKMAVKMIELMDNIPGVTKAEIIEDIRLFKRSGLHTSIKRVANLTKDVQGLTPGIINGFARFVNKGTVMYEQGELFGRLVAYNIAKTKWEKANPGKVIDDKALTAIVRETNRMHMNFQRENSAQFQEGGLRAASQFSQVQAKYSEKTVPGLLHGKKSKDGWTRSEAARVVAGQVVLYGLTAIPFLETGSYLAQTLGYNSIVEMQKEHPLLTEATLDGALGFAFEMAGFHNQFGGDTASIMASLDDSVATKIIEALLVTIQGGFVGEDGLISFLLGPSETGVQRLHNAIKETAKSLKTLYAIPTVDRVGKEILTVASEWGAITSTWSNLRRGIWMETEGRLYNSKGKVLVNEADGGFNWQTIFAQMMGIPTDKSAALYTLKQHRTEINAYKAEAYKAYLDLMLKAARTGDVAKYEALTALWMKPFSDTEISEFQERAINEVNDQKTTSALAKELQRYQLTLIKSMGRPKPISPSTGLADALQKNTEEE